MILDTNRYLLFIAVLQYLLIAPEAFAPAAAPSNGRRRKISNPIIQGVRINDLLVSTTNPTALLAKRKGGESSVAKGGKVQVKLLKHIAGTGQAGDVVMVTPAFFNNKLRPTQSAQIISDEEVSKEQSEAEKEEKEAIATATALKEKIQDLKLTLKKKAGPDGQLFGGINTKMIVAELQDALGDEKEYLSQKQVKISELSDGEGKKMRGDIKHTGTFDAKISLRKDTSAKFNVVVEAES